MVYLSTASLNQYSSINNVYLFYSDSRFIVESKLATLIQK